MTMRMDERPARRYARSPRRLEFPSEAEVPESKRHLELRTTLYLVLKLAFKERAMIGSDQFVYWDATDPSACVAPDVFVRMGEKDELFSSWKTWERGAPHVAVEIVSSSDESPESWATKLAKYHRLGISELVRFQADEPSSPLRVWDYVEGDLMERELSPDSTAECVSLGLWWTVQKDAELGLVLRLSRDAAGRDLLPTESELRESERDAALEEVRTLKQELSRR
jgi:Uma2 family endonuclease